VGEIPARQVTVWQKQTRCYDRGVRFSSIGIIAFACVACASQSKAPPFVATPTFCACAVEATAKGRFATQDAAPDVSFLGYAVTTAEHSRLLVAFGFSPEVRIRAMVDDWILAHELVSKDLDKNPIGPTARALLVHRWKGYAFSWTSKLEGDAEAWRKALESSGPGSSPVIEAEFTFHDHLAAALDDVSQRLRTYETRSVESLIHDGWLAQPKSRENSLTKLAIGLSNEAAVETSTLLPIVTATVRWQLPRHVHAAASAMTETIIAAQLPAQQAEWLTIAAAVKSPAPKP
jgi:hypothetical protein